MCGICGVIRFGEPVNDADRAAVAVMSAHQAHRGPDAQGVHEDDHVLLGHRRLAVLDVSEQAAQPMGSPDGQIWLTYNGEIYNFTDLRHELTRAGHTFRSTSDTEVLLLGYAHWGIDGLLPRLRGMFAFALYDRTPRHAPDPRSPRVYLARDALGIKPLYFVQDAAQLSFASEVRALVAAGRARGVDPTALLGFLALGSVPSPRTIIPGVCCLAPGHYLEVALDSGEARSRRWAITDVLGAARAAAGLGGTGGGATTRDARDRLASALVDSVERHLVADIPVGVFLSGGVDSGALVALAARAGHHVPTLTVSLPGDDADETARAEATARHFNTDHQLVRVGLDELSDARAGFLGAMDQPSIDGLNTYLISAVAARAGLRVVLSGLGADEVFSGYRHHRLLARHRLLAGWAGRPTPAAALVGRAARVYGRARRADRWERWGYLASPGGAAGCYLGFRGLFPPRHIAALLGAEEREVRAAVGGLVAQPDGSEPDLGHALRRIEAGRYLHDQLLRDADVFAMAHSVELRVPYLEQGVLAAAGRTPRGARVHPRINKPALVAAVGDPRIQALAHQPKTGFTLPMDRWLREAADARELGEAEGLLDRRAVARIWADFDAGRLHWSRPWALLIAGAALHPARASAPLAHRGGP